MEKKTVLITGASSGIGEGCARKFAMNGYRLILNGRNVEKLTAVKRELETEYRADVCLLPFDVRDRGAAKAALDSLPEEWKAIDILINNAGLVIGVDKEHEGNPDEWDIVLDTNIKALLAMTRLVVPGMVERGCGHVINMGSIAGDYAYPGGSVYCASKAAVKALSDGLRIDLVDTPVRVTNIKPGLVETNFSVVRFRGDKAAADNVYKGIRPLTGDQKWWNTLKIRASYGVTGNNSISNTAAYATLTSSVYGGAAGYYTSSLGNADLGWEKTHSTDIAVDLGFLNNRIQLSLDWYTKNTTDLLYQVPVEGASGFSTIWDNLGDIHNEGFEIELNTHNLTGNFKWDTSFNMSYNKNEVKKLGTDNTPIYSGFSGSNYSNILTVGKAVNTYYMYDAIGVWKNQAEIDAYSAAHNGQPVTFEGKQIQPGDIRYRDVNNDGKYDKDNDRDYLGSPTPKFVFGMTNRFSYKNFDLSILLTAQTGGKIYGILGRAIDRPSMGAKSNIMGHWRDAWWSEDEPGNGSVPYILSQTTGTTLDSRWLYSSNYLRIKNLTLGYKLPINPKFISYARVYLSIENLAKWDSYYGGYSPEAANVGSGPGGASALGLDYGGYPNARTFTFGINVNF